MSTAALVTFWLSVGVILYVYVGYPLLLALIALVRKPVKLADPDTWPSVTLLITAYNEQANIAAKLDNALTLDYPPDRCQILVASDGSTDDTDAIVRRYADRGVELRRVEGRVGKTQTQNEAMPHARGEIVVFTDADAMFDADAIKQLVRHFQRPAVGCVEGRRCDRAADATTAAPNELLFRDYESLVKRLESRVYSCVGAVGPIMAIRRELYVPLHPDDCSDLIEPMAIMLAHGRRQVFEPRARSRELVLGRVSSEFRRKIRVITDSLASLWRYRAVMNPFRTGVYAWQVVSHRFLRWILPLFLALALLSNALLVQQPVYGALMGLQLLFYGSALLGALLERFGIGHALLRAPYFFCAANAASLVSVFNCLLGRKYVRWDTART